MYLPSDHSVLVEFASTIKPKFDINVRDFDFLVILACENNRQDILDYILVSKSIPFSKERLTSLKNLEKKLKKNIKNQNIETCFICIEPFNKTTHSLVKCKCDYQCCRTCVKYYILNNPQDPHCMNCKVSWDRKMLTDNFEAKFINNDLKEYRENVLFERELGMMQQTQIHVDNEILIENLEKNNCDIRNEISKLQDNINNNNNLIYKIKYGKTEKTERRTFIRKCPNGDCRGFLSTNLKCSICEKWACGDCREVKGDTRDAEHTCNKDALESIKILEKETKECPKCSYKIYKIDGCNQIYCTPEYGGCGTAFDWKTLKIETKIHNPHYYEYMRKQGTLQREAGDIICGQELHYNFYSNLSKKINPKENKTIFDMIRMIQHTKAVELRRFTPNARESNLDLRILYMRKKITAESMKKDIQKREKDNDKKKEIFNVIQMFVQCTTDIFYRLYNDPKLIDNILKEIHTLGMYTNECLKNISKSYKCTEYYFNQELEFGALKKIKQTK
jgi:hypothetical protein